MFGALVGEAKRYREEFESEEFDSDGESVKRPKLERHEDQDDGSVESERPEGARRGEKGNADVACG